MRVGEMLQIFGELLVEADGSRTLRARIARNVNGLNIELYERAVEAKRAFERELSSSFGPNGT